MRIVVRNSLVCFVLTAASLYAQSDKMDNALKNLASEDTSASHDAENFLTKHSQDAEKGLLQLFEQSVDPVARFRAAKLLGVSGNKAAAPDMQERLLSGKEDNATVRAEIIRALVRLGSSNTLLDYLKQGKDNSPTVNAAIAIGLQGNTDEESKKALGTLLESEDRRVFEAAFTAVCKTYQPISSADANCPSSTEKKPASNKAPRVSLAPENTGNEPPSPGDEAVIQALQSRKASNDPEISRTATGLLRTLSSTYKLQ